MPDNQLIVLHVFLKKVGLGKVGNRGVDIKSVTDADPIETLCGTPFP